MFADSRSTSFGGRASLGIAPGSVSMPKEYSDCVERTGIHFK